MGRTNKQWSHVIGIGIEVAAPDQLEAARRMEDARDALQARFAGSEIYPPRIDGTASRIAGSPIFKHFLLVPGRPTQVDPFNDAVSVTSDRLASMDAEVSIPAGERDRAQRIEQLASELVVLIRQSIDAGWMPNQGNINDTTVNLESLLNIDV
jgi:hypothetical protein